MSHLEELLLLQLRAEGLPEPVREFRFYPTRRWRFDLCWPDRLLAFEVEGGQYVMGRHQRPKGYAADAEKYSHAAIAGFRVLRATGEQIEDGRAVAWLKQALGEAA
jgi:hypothetical protein